MFLRLSNGYGPPSRQTYSPFILYDYQLLYSFSDSSRRRNDSFGLHGPPFACSPSPTFTSRLTFSSNADRSARFGYPKHQVFVSPMDSTSLPYGCSRVHWPFSPALLALLGFFRGEIAELILCSGLHFGRHRLAVYPDLPVLAVTSGYADEGCLDCPLLPGCLVRMVFYKRRSYAHRFIPVHLSARSSRLSCCRLCTALTLIKHVRTIITLTLTVSRTSTNAHNSSGTVAQLCLWAP